MSLNVGTGKAKESNDLVQALQRGRFDHEFFGHFFLNRPPHPAQLDFLDNAEATVNCLATANRWGKTVVLSHIHFHSHIYKSGAEMRYLDAKGNVDVDAFVKLRYHTVHTGGEWETAALVWDESHKLIGESDALRAFVRDAPRSKPPHIDFISGSRWKFRTLGYDASGIDGNSFYVISIDEAGWIEDLGRMMDNVIRVRVADVGGRIYIVGTFKPGVSRDFYRFCVKASAYTGAQLGFDHRDQVEEDVVIGGLDGSIRRYLHEYGINLDEYTEAVGGER